MSHSEPEGGSVKPNGEAAAARILVATRRPGNSPVLMMPPSRGAWRCNRGRGRSLPGRADEPRRWQARRAETVLAATVGHRHAAAAAWVGSAKASRAFSQHLLRLRPSRTARRRIAHYNLATLRPPRRRVMRPRGAVDCIALAGVRQRSAAPPASRTGIGRAPGTFPLTRGGS